MNLGNHLIVCGHQIYDRLSMDENDYIFKYLAFLAISDAFENLQKGITLSNSAIDSRCDGASIARCVNCGDDIQALTLLVKGRLNLGVSIRCMRCKMRPNSSNGL